MYARAVASTSAPEHPLDWRSARWVLAISAVPVVLSLVYALTLGIDRGALLRGRGTFTAWPAALSATLTWSALATAVLAIVVTAWVPRFRPYVVVAVAATLVAFVSVGCLGVVPFALGRMPARMGTPVRAPDGTDWAVVRWGIGQGRGISIARLAGQGGPWIRGEIVVTSGTDSPCEPAACIRLAGSDPTHTLLVGEDGVVAAVDGTDCWVAWSPRTGEAWTNEAHPEDEDPPQPEPSDSPRREHALDRMSPFLLLGDALEGRAEDLEEIAAMVAREARRAAAEGTHRDPLAVGAWGEGALLPDRDVLETSLDSPNPWVRAAARRILDAAVPGNDSGR